eukprot:1006772-Alexandrium_andersonii.AAC.1
MGTLLSRVTHGMSNSDQTSSCLRMLRMPPRFLIRSSNHPFVSFMTPMSEPPSAGSICQSFVR